MTRAFGEDGKPTVGGKTDVLLIIVTAKVTPWDGYWECTGHWPLTAAGQPTGPAIVQGLCQGL